MKYEDFIEEARAYRKTFKYFFTTSDLKNKWILLLIATQATGLLIYFALMPKRFETLSDVAGMAIGFIIILAGGLLRSKFDKEKLRLRLFDLKLIKSKNEKFSHSDMSKKYILKICLPKMGDINKLLEDVSHIEKQIYESKSILDNTIGFNIFEGLFSFKRNHNPVIFTVGVAILGTIAGMYLEDIKLLISEFYETPANYVIFSLTLLIAAIFIIMMASFFFGVLGIFIIRYLDLHDRHLSKYARHQFKIDLLMFAEVGSSKKSS